MGRAPCCDKANVKKGPWSPEEDAKLKSYIEQHGTGGNWIALPQKIGLKRCGKSCRLRWLNYLRPNLKHGGFSEEEDNIICSLYISIGSRWSVIAAQLPGRTDNDIKNYWNTRLKKKLFGKHRNKEARNRGNCVKQDKNNNGGNNGEYPLSLVQENSVHQQPYLPPMPVVLSPPPQPLQYTNQGPCFNDQDSIRKLLIKLGGRFSNEYHHPTFDGSQQIYQEQVHVGSSACIDNNEVVQFGDQYSPQVGVGLDLVQREGSFTPTIEALVSSNYIYPQRLDGLEFFYEEDMIDDKIIGSSTSCSQSTRWGGETSTPMYHSHASDFQG